jgi:hypothetical protein
MNIPIPGYVLGRVGHKGEADHADHNGDVGAHGYEEGKERFGLGIWLSESPSYLCI